MKGDVRATLRRYVLGELEEEPRLELEQRLLSDAELFEELGATEQELIEEYLDDSLPPAQKEGFRQSFLTSGEHTRELAFVRLLREHAAAASRHVVPAAAPMAPFGPRRRWQTSQFAAAAVLCLLGAGTLWLADERVRLQRDLERLRVQLADAARLLAESRQTERPGAEAVPTFSLAAGVLRSEGVLNRIAVPPGFPMFRLRLELPRNDYRSYRVALYDAEAEELWAQGKLKAELIGGRATITAAVPSEVASRGDYQVRVSGLSASGVHEAVSTYTFRVTDR